MIPPASASPVSTPFDLPIQVGHFTCQLERPLELPERSGASLATTVRGAFSTALLAGDHPPTVFLRPRSDVQGRDHPPAVVLRPRLSSTTPTNLGLDFTLLGRQALLARATAFEAVEVAGRSGLKDASGLVRFRVERADIFEGTLQSWLSATLPLANPPPQLLLEILSPLDAKVFDLATILGNAACDLVLWDLEDSGRAEALGRLTCSTLAEQARELATRTLDGLELDDRAVQRISVGHRRSRSNGGHFELGGFTGSLTLSGDLSAVLPWLGWLSLRGGGSHRSFGLGGVRCWFPASGRGPERSGNARP